MVIGSGLLAQVFSPVFLHREDVCIYAAGVSNSNCNDSQEFLRERRCLANALQEKRHTRGFVYFGTCSVADSEANKTPYVEHKIAMEQLVATHPDYLILRLPQIAGNTFNPNTLLNFLRTQILRGESFSLWSKAKRNIIDVDDVLSIARELIDNDSLRNVTVNVASPRSHFIAEIVREMECAMGKRAIYEVVDRGSEYPIDISAILPLVERAAVNFGDNYLKRVVEKYYGKVSL